MEPRDTSPPEDTEQYLLPADSHTMEIDRLLRLLADYRRRRILAYLLGNDGWASLQTVCDSIIMGELGVDPKGVPERRKRLYLNLYHHHVPMMESNGVIEFDHNDDRIKLTTSPSVEAWIVTILESSSSQRSRRD